MAIKEIPHDEPGLPISLPGKESPLQRGTQTALSTVLRRLTDAPEATTIRVGDSFLIDRISVDTPDSTAVGRRRVLPTSGAEVPSEVVVEDYSKALLPIAPPLQLDTELGKVVPIHLPDDYDETPLPTLRITFRKDGEGSRFNGEVMFFEKSNEVSVRAECLIDQPASDKDREFYGFAHSLGLGSVWKAYTNEDGPAPALGVYDADLSDELGRQMAQALEAQG